MIGAVMERLIGVIAIGALFVVVSFLRLALENWGYLLLAAIAAGGVGYLVHTTRRQG
jgi:hypothetical protein